MPIISTIAAIGGSLLAGAGAVAGGLAGAAATAASAVASGAMSIGSAIASGAIGVGELVISGVVSAGEVLGGIAVEGGNVLSAAESILQAGAGTIGDVFTGVVAAGENILPYAEQLVTQGGLSAKDAVMYVAQAGGDVGSLANSLIQSGKPLGDVVSGMAKGGYDATKFIGQQLINGKTSLSGALTASQTAGLNMGAFSKGLVESGITGAQDVMTAVKESTSPIFQYGSSAYTSIKDAVSPYLPSAGQVANTIGQGAEIAGGAVLGAGGAVVNAGQALLGAGQTAYNAAGGANAAGGLTGSGLLNTGLNVGAALLQNQQAQKATQTQTDAQNRALDILQQNMTQTREDLIGARQTGRADIQTGTQQAIGQLSQYSQGYNGVDYLNLANQYLTNPMAALNDPGAAWELEQGRKDLANALTAKSGGGLSGQALKEASQYAINFASTKTDEAINRLTPFIQMQTGATSGIANLYAQQGTQLANLGVQTVPQTAGQAQNIASTVTGLGDIQAQKDVNRANLYGNVAGILTA